MKLLLLLASLCAFLATYGQTDTIRWYYQNGNLASIQPFQDAQLIGDGFQYYITGELKSHSKYNQKTKSTFTTSFYKNGVVQAEYIIDSLGTSSSKTYYENGNLQRYSKQIKNGTYIQDGYQNGQTKNIAITENGSLISCIAYQQKDSTLSENYCYCGAKRVYWKQDHWEDQGGNITNSDFRYILKQFGTSGKKVSQTTQKAYEKKSKTRIKNRWKKTRSLDSADVILIPYQEPGRSVSENFLKELPEGYPLLREPNPPRDTMVRKYTLKQLTDSTIHWEILTRTYDSLRQAISIFSNYGEIKIQEEKSNSGFVWYGDSKTNISFQINMVNSSKAKVYSTSGYSFYATDKEISVVWEE